ncbi:MAG: YHS domain-containing protein, partial [Proteobacteria bacterium]|nr:YHS domain-containing protein [Pseudomonadota bacterium]
MHHHQSKEQKSQYTDPVCGMSTAQEGKFIHHKHDGKSYYFCSEHCLTTFKTDPEKFTGKKEEAPSAVKHTHDSSQVYTCPMHPEVEQQGPGSCPKCGMALEPRTVSLTEEESNPEYEDMRKRFIVGAILTLPLVIIAMRGLIPGGRLLDTLATLKTYEWLELILATPVVVWAGWPFYVRAVQSVINRSLNMFTLIGLGVSVAYLYSLIGVLFPHLFPAAMRTAEGTVGVYFEAAGVIVVLILLGQVLELRARSRTGAAIKALLGLAPKTARKIDADGNESDIPLEQVMKGDRLRVRPGEKIPVD